VATVVCKLLLAVPADVAYFGAKDWQQTLVVKRMVRDLGLSVEIVVCPTVREADGLAMSSRNAYLSPAERLRAVALWESLRRAEQLWASGANAAAIERAMQEMMAAQGVAVDYASLADPESLAPVADDAVRAVALVAGRLGSTRLIDNLELSVR
jgi:pantoate--beta-alanine ligase